MKNYINILDLSKNRIKSLKPLRRLPRLKMLNIKENALDSLVGPKSLHYLPNLIFLDVSCNPVRSIDKQAFLKNKYLDRLIYDFILYFYRTFVVRMQCFARHTVKDIYNLFYSMQNCVYLRVLSLRAAWPPQSTIALTASMSKYLPAQNLIYLSLRFNRIPEVEIGFFDGFKKLKTLEMNYCRTKFKKHQFIALSNLRHIDLQQNNIRNLNLTDSMITKPKLRLFLAGNSPGLTCFDRSTSFPQNNTLIGLRISCVIEAKIGRDPNNESPCLVISKNTFANSRSFGDRDFYLKKDIRNLRELRLLMITITSPYVFLCLKTFDLLPANSIVHIAINSLTGPYNDYLMKRMLLFACESLVWGRKFYKLKSLYLTGTIIGNCPCRVIYSILSRVPSLELLDLSRNGIRQLDANLFKIIPNLKVLVLKNNRLSSIQPGLFKPLMNLHTLNLVSNHLKTFDPSQIMHLKRLRYARLHDNDFSCDCQLRPMRNWLIDLENHRNKKHFYYDLVSEFNQNRSTLKLVCNSPRKLSGVPIVNFQLSWMECDNHKDIIISLSTLCVAAIIMVIGRIVAKKRWEIFYWWMVNINKLLPKLLQRKTEDLCSSTFDGFLSHSMEDLQFVYLNFIPEIENSKDFASKFCIEFRDFTIGGYIQKNNIDAIYGSRWVVFLLTESFIDEEWAEFVISMAANRCVEESNNIILVLNIDHIPVSRMPESLRTIISNVVHMKYPRNDRGISTFWKKVRLTLIGKQKKFIRPANMFRSSRLSDC
ncbi:uncharacterized protein LOC141898361 [Tubulanus polymorphus]|uniref:uncharacterized protein LOC141898361 n=1 Tax=Tubulanus polymorphus TaxID=672921 RepID=UPI003DA686BC